MTDAIVSYYYASIFISRNFPFCVQLTWGQCGTWYKECLWTLKSWPHWPEAVYIFPAGNDSLQIQIRPTMVFTTQSYTFRHNCRPFSGSVVILMDYVLFFSHFHGESEVFRVFFFIHYRTFYSSVDKEKRWKETSVLGEKVGQIYWNMFREFFDVTSWPSKTTDVSSVSCRARPCTD